MCIEATKRKFRVCSLTMVVTYVGSWFTPRHLPSWHKARLNEEGSLCHWHCIYLLKYSENLATKAQEMQLLKGVGVVGRGGPILKNSHKVGSIDHGDGSNPNRYYSTCQTNLSEMTLSPTTTPQCITQHTSTTTTHCHHQHKLTFTSSHHAS